MPYSERRIALVLGGGGLKGFAHIGILRAIAERGIRPATFAGTSIGALIAAAYATGMSVEEMTERALALKRHDLFRLNHVGMLVQRMRSASIYLEAPLRALCESVVPDITFGAAEQNLLVNTVDIDRATRVVWGLPGLRDVKIADAVYASCALPGFFPPGTVGGRLCIDGGTVDNMPVSIAAVDSDAVIAVDVGNVDLGRAADIAQQGFANIYMRAASAMMHALQERPLEHWTGPPMLLIRPRISHIGWFDFSRTRELIDEGYRAAKEALITFESCLSQPGGIYPRRPVHVAVDRNRCTGCGTCVALAPELMAFDASRKAYAKARVVEWSPADGDFVNHCPTDAIEVCSVDSHGPPVQTEARAMAS